MKNARVMHLSVQDSGVTRSGLKINNRSKYTLYLEGFFHPKLLLLRLLFHRV